MQRFFLKHLFLNSPPSKRKIDDVMEHEESPKKTLTCRGLVVVGMSKDRGLVVKMDVTWGGREVEVVTCSSREVEGMVMEVVETCSGKEMLEME